ncbi:hypothetical protein DPEC_G00076660 [Dallia pectoralis]|uniref:Uncharacterized protein n=1 Tax=Dallia pectoralis TaxID=75939 RepID=A0ACC2H3V9_DALPE|nr:hypothetical protein DPEC_G00076660 [Dallia pectoralis]
MGNWKRSLMTIDQQDGCAVSGCFVWGSYCASRWHRELRLVGLSACLLLAASEGQEGLAKGHLGSASQTKEGHRRTEVNPVMN